jgi:hypothetical protein
MAETKEPKPSDKNHRPALGQYKYLQDAFHAIPTDLMPKFNIQIPNTVINNSAITKTAFNMANIVPTYFPKSIWENTGIATIAAQQNASLVQTMKPVIDSLSSGITARFASINSDLLKNIGLSQPNLNFLSKSLTDNAFFGWSDQLAKITKQYAVQQADWLKDIVSNISRLKSDFYPSNLRDIDGLSLEDVQQVVMLDGITLYEVPRAEIAEKLIRATSSADRRTIIGRKWREITSDCQTVLRSCNTAELIPMVTFASACINALEAGNTASAQSLSASIIDTLLNQYLHEIKPLLVPSKNNRNAKKYSNFSVRKYIALAPIWQTYQHYYPSNGDKIPRTFNRHATAHTVSRQQYSRRNAIQGLMLVCGLLAFIDKFVLR